MPPLFGRCVEHIGSQVVRGLCFLKDNVVRDAIGVVTSTATVVAHVAGRRSSDHVVHGLREGFAAGRDTFENVAPRVVPSVVGQCLRHAATIVDTVLLRTVHSAAIAPSAGEDAFILIEDPDDILRMNWYAGGDPALGGPNYAEGKTAYVHIPLMDIDTDSNNNGSIDGSIAEDLIEDVPEELGKRIFVNTEDDNKNGKVDSDDIKSDYTTGGFTDDDFAELSLDFSHLGEDAFAGYKLVLSASFGLNLWADKMKTPLSDLPNPPVDDWGDYVWELDGSGNVALPSTLYAEGVVSGSHSISWTLFDPVGIPCVSDSVKINVESVVWPNQDSSANWDPTETTDQWNGFALGPGWYISKSLSDLITQGTAGGYIRTEYPMETSSGRWEGTAAQNDSAILDLGQLAGMSGGTWDGSTIRIEVTYDFDQSPNIPVGEFVDTDILLPSGNSRYQASFFGNSGIKLENRAEIQIFDTDSLLDVVEANPDGTDEMLDGQTRKVRADAATINAGGQVATKKVVPQHFDGTAWQNWHSTDADQINSLITGLPYGYPGLDYLPGESNTDRLDRAPKGGQTMVILVSRGSSAGDPYTIEVTVPEMTSLGQVAVTRTYTGIQNTAGTMANNLIIQSHWGSGVKFTSLKVRKS